MSLVSEFNRFVSNRYESNPPRGEEPFTAFLRELSRTGRIANVRENEWFTLGRTEGLTDEETAELVEQAASWLDGKESGLAPASWTGLK